MTDYVIRRNEDGRYVTRPGSRKSYSPLITDARRFPSKAAAEADACGNERVLPYDHAEPARSRRA